MRERNRRLGQLRRPAALTRVRTRGRSGRGRTLRPGRCRRGRGCGRRGGWHGGCGNAAAVGTALAVTGSVRCRDRCARGRCPRGPGCCSCCRGRRARRRTAVFGLVGPCLPGRRLSRECFLEPADDWRLNRGGRRSHELAHFLELGHHGLALYAELLRELVYPDLRHCAPSTWSGSAGPVKPVGAARAPSGVSLCCSSPHAHRSFIAISACFPGPCCHGRTLLSRPRRLAVRPGVTRRNRSRLPKILGELAGPDRSRQPQRPRQSPAPLRFLKASLAGVQVRTPAWPSRWHVRNDFVPGRHQTKQVGLGRTAAASYTGPDRWRVPSLLRMPCDHLYEAYNASPRGDDPP